MREFFEGKRPGGESESGGTRRRAGPEAFADVGPRPGTVPSHKATGVDIGEFLRSRESARPRDGGDRSSDGDDGPGGRETGDEKFDPVAVARADAMAVAMGVAEIRGDLLEAIAAMRRATLAASEQLTWEIELAERQRADYLQLGALMDEMLARGAGQAPDLGCQAVSMARALQAETKRARKKWPGRVWDKIWKKLKAVLPRLWSMISHLLTVKEWTVTGQAGTGVFGLAQVGISITFG